MPKGEHGRTSWLDPIVELMPTAAALIRPDGSFVRANAAFLTELEAGSTLPAVPLTELIRGPGADQLTEQLRAMFSGEREDVNASAEVELRSGVVRHVAIRGRAVSQSDADDRTAMIVVDPIAGTKSSAEHRLRAAYRELQQQFGQRTDELGRNVVVLRTLLESLAVGVVATDADGKVTLFNDRAREIIGHRGPDVPHESWSELAGICYGDGQTPYPASDLPLARALRGETVIQEELVVRPDKQHRGAFCLVSARPLLNDGKVVGAVAVVDELTRRRDAERRQRELNAQEMETQKLESLGVLAGGIAHDFNNLLTGVLGHTDLALRLVPEGSAVEGHLEAIATATQHATELARQMLAYSGKGRFIVAPTNLSDVIHNMSPLLESVVKKRARLELDLATPLDAIDADVAQLRQLLVNLVTNAAEACESQGTTIRVSTRAAHYSSKALNAFGPDALPPRRYVQLAIADDGCGMDDPTAARAFEPFFSTKFTGRGLGLAAVSGIVRGHKGAITFDSDAGRGTLIRVLLPTRTTQMVSDETPAATQATRPTVLLADDEAVVRTQATDMLESLGYDVIPATDGREAVELFKAHRDQIDLLLLDIVMPHLAGEFATTEIMALDSKAKVILCSGYPPKVAQERFLGLGVTGFLQKPYELTKLRAALKAANPDGSSSA